MVRKKIVLFCFSLVGILLIWKTFFGTNSPSLQPKNQYSRIFYDTKGRPLRITLTSDEKYRFWTPLSQVSPLLIQATLLHEDRFFYYHPGVNPVSLGRAAYETYVAGGRRMGGSTLTMQLARLRFGFSSKEALGKVKQIAYALWLELYYSKEAILEAYLNTVPYGGNIEGVGAAAQVYFGKPPNQLTLKEALSLAVIPQNPVARGLKTFEKTDLKKRSFFNARQGLFTKWCQKYPEGCKKQPQIDLEKTPLLKHLPFSAPHFVNFLLREPTNLQQEIKTTLDLDLQKHLEKRIQTYLSHHRKQGFYNAAALLLDYRSMAVKAWIGSANFFDTTIQGQVDGVLAKRSPGSTLKPFIYALAIDQGLIHPASLLKDAPYSKASYDPENFDQDFLGPVTAEDALNLSRNIPAVFLANSLKKPDLYDFLKNAGVFLPKPKTFYGLSLVLGSAELAMLDLAKLYAVLANQGRLSAIAPTRLFDFSSTRLLSPEASFLTLEMLKNNHHSHESKTQRFPIYWKTGTSFGFKDAWTVGIFGPYVLAVWLGDFEGKSNPNLVGRASAAPPFFDLVKSLSERPDFMQTFQRAPTGVKQIEVCALSGQIPGTFCPHRKMTWFIPGKSSIHTCIMHREVTLDAKSELRVCPGFKGKTKTRVYEFWPSDLLEVFEEAHIKRETPPAFHPQCLFTQKEVLANDLGLYPVISSPQRNTTYHIRLTNARTSQIPLKAITDADVRVVYWFVNKAFIGGARKNELFFWKADVGNHQLTVVDDQGRSTSMELTVKATQ